MTGALSICIPNGNKSLRKRRPGVKVTGRIFEACKEAIWEENIPGDQCTESRIMFIHGTFRAHPDSGSRSIRDPACSFSASRTVIGLWVARVGEKQRRSEEKPDSEIMLTLARKLRGGSPPPCRAGFARLTDPREHRQSDPQPSRLGQACA
ncbi:hypothetical protein BJY00DRAFT_30164 [Aspergillus carlsbadensis]|nr:hypothetical protein BJY00DRAFT_30164 [Aspergillus carlsbadensis]